jgi:hypothetical protein
MPQISITPFRDPGAGRPSPFSALEGIGEAVASFSPQAQKERKLKDLQTQVQLEQAQQALKNAKMTPEEKFQQELGQFAAKEQLKADIQQQMLSGEMAQKARYNAEVLDRSHQNELNVLEERQKDEMERLMAEGAQETAMQELKQKHARELAEMKQAQQQEVSQYAQNPTRSAADLDPHKPNKYIYLGGKLQSNPEYESWMRRADKKVENLETQFLGKSADKPGRLSKAREAEYAAKKFKEINKKVETGGAPATAWNKVMGFLGDEGVKNLEQISTQLMLTNKPPGMGAMSNAEWEILRQATLSIKNPKEVNDRIADKMIQVAKGDREYWNFYQSLVEQYGPQEAATMADRLWTQYTRDNPYFTPTEEGGLEINDTQKPWQEYFGSFEAREEAEDAPRARRPSTTHNGLPVVKSQEMFDSLEEGEAFYTIDSAGNYVKGIKQPAEEGMNQEEPSVMPPEFSVQTPQQRGLASMPPVVI